MDMVGVLDLVVTKNYQIHQTVTFSGMVVRTNNSCRRSTGSFPRSSQFYFPIFVTKLVCRNDGRDYEVICGGHQLPLPE